MGPWRFVIGDLLGRPLSSVGSIAKEVAGADRFLRPDSLRLRVPSDDARVAGLHTDGYPKVARLRRTLRAYEPIGDNAWAIRFAGIIFGVQDIGEGDNAQTTITAFDPMQRLASRFTGVDAADRVGEGGALLRTLIADTNALGYTGIATTGYGNVAETTPTQTVKYDRRQIGDAALELAGAYNGFDPILRPIHQPAGTEDGTLAALDIYARAGTNRPNVVFAWGMAPHNLQRIERNGDGVPVANALTGFGWTPPGATAPISQVATTPASIAAYGRYEALEQFGDVTNTAFLQQLLAEEASLRADGRELVTITPSTGDDARRVPRPWRDFTTGDTVQVRAGAALRGGFSGLQRVYGFSYTVNDEGVTTIDQMLVSPDDTA